MPLPEPPLAGSPFSTFLLLPPFRQRWLGALIGMAAFIAGLYHWRFEADLVQVLMDLSSGRPVPWPDEWRSRLQVELA